MMQKLNQIQIQERAREILDQSPSGIRWSELLRTIEKEAPETPINTIQGAVHSLLGANTSEIIKVARGSYRLAKFIAAEDRTATERESTTAITTVQSETSKAQTLTEQDFYASFADWLKENDEVTFASPLGGGSLGGKWGTPDVIGVLKPRAQDIFKFEPQIVTAEIKVITTQPVVAFGQAVAYRLFSHKSYVVLPNSTSIDDINRLKSLCSIHGVGLVTFVLDKSVPNYSLLILPVTATPDMFYVNSMLERLKSNAPNLLNNLF